MAEAKPLPTFMLTLPMSNHAPRRLYSFMLTLCPNSRTFSPTVSLAIGLPWNCLATIGAVVRATVGRDRRIVRENIVSSLVIRGDVVKTRQILRSAICWALLSGRVGYDVSEEKAEPHSLDGEIRHVKSWSRSCHAPILAATMIVGTQRSRMRYPILVGEMQR